MTSFQTKRIFKLMSAIAPISFGKLPNTSDAYSWADYIELLCLINKDQEISKADIIDRINESSDIGDLDSSDDTESLGDLSIPEQNDKWELKTDDWFRHFEYRSYTFKSFYPFALSDDGDVLHRQINLTSEQQFYIFLLLASNIKYIRSLNHKVTTSFEDLCADVMKACLPASAKIHVFGTSKYREVRYTGNFWEKINRLAVDLHLTIHAKEEKIAAKNSGDGGLDIVGWVPMGDSSTGKLFVFGQAACTEKWVIKQHSSSRSVWGSIFALTYDYINMIFIPICFRDSSGDWWDPTKIAATILFDRQRLIYFLNEQHILLQRYPVYEDVIGIIDFREPLV